MPSQGVIVAHTHSSRHREEILASELCGCLYCRATFSPGEMLDWVDENPSGDGMSSEGTTALCPRCGIDSVLGSRSGYPIAAEFLEEMNRHWFQRSVPFQAPPKRLHVPAAVGGVRRLLAAAIRWLLQTRPAG